VPVLAILPTAIPRPVTVAVRLLYALAVLPVISAVLQLALHRVDGFTASSSVVTLLLIGLLAYYVGRGRNVARIVLWVAAAGEALSMASYAALMTATGHPASWPGWYLPFTLAQRGLTVAVLAAASVLVTLPAARPHFRRRPPVGTPGPQPTEEHREASSPA
jgi:hypothetical protein